MPPSHAVAGAAAVPAFPRFVRVAAQFTAVRVPFTAVQSPVTGGNVPPAPQWELLKPLRACRPLMRRASWRLNHPTV